MKYIIIEDGSIYSVPDKNAENINVAAELAAATDDDMSLVIQAVKEQGKYVGEVYTTIRN